MQLPSVRRTTPLTQAEIDRYHEHGCLFPIRILDEEQVLRLRDALGDHLAARIATDTYELTDQIRVRGIEKPSGQVTFEYEETGISKPHTFAFVLNLWKRDSRFREVATDPVLAGMARQLLNCKEVVLLEDNVVIKYPNTRVLPWHQDYAYWPIATPAAITIWIALDAVGPENGTMEMVPGSQSFGERLPVQFGDATSYMREHRPEAGEVPQDPRAKGYQVVQYELNAGECGFHHAMIWHASTANMTEKVRRAFVVRYAVAGTIWLGNERFPYDDVGLSVGDPIGGPNFPLVQAAF
jgi:ectoine hydroxylase-related dioxygenase (phytanoyl-CoA dioxygenase family)